MASVETVQTLQRLQTLQGMYGLAVVRQGLAVVLVHHGRHAVGAEGTERHTSCQIVAGIVVVIGAAVVVGGPTVFFKIFQNIIEKRH